MKLTIAPLLLASISLAACSVAHSNEATSAGLAAVNNQIAQAVQSAAATNNAVAQVEVATAKPDRAGPAQTVPPGVVLPPSAVQPVTVDWQGPIEPFLAAMAKRAGYTFKVEGKRPANPMMISITANKEPLFGVLRRAGAMANGYADIAFNPSEKLIEIRYGA